MAVPSVATYSAAAKKDANDAFLALIDAGSGAGKIRIRSASDTLLAEIALNDPGGTVNAGTGVLTLSIAGPDSSANATGTAAYCEICDSDNTVHLSIPAQQGTVAVSGKIVMNTLSIVSGGPVEIVSATIG